jgi:NitT/TauT family transport system permease protein
MSTNVVTARPASIAQRVWLASLLTGWRNGRSARVAIRVTACLACVAVWQVASIYRVDFIVNFQNIPSPGQVARASVDLLYSPKLFAHIGNSLRRVFAGFGAAALLGIGLGLIIGRSRLAEDSLLAPLELLRPVPAVAWIPMAILMFASSEGSIIFITFIGAFFPILLNTIHGVETIDRNLIAASRSLGAGPVSIFLEVVLPGSLPSVVTGLSIGMGTCWFSLVSAEMISGQFGIGYYTWEAYNLQKYPPIVVGMIAIGLLGMGSSALVRAVGAILMPWRRLEQAQGR